MSIGRIIVLALAAVAAGFVALYIRAQSNRPVEAAAPVIETTQVVDMPERRVLAAKVDITAGRRVSPEDLMWQPWPEEAVSSSYMTEADFPNALADYAGAVARVEIVRGEPITGGKLVNPGDAGFMAAVLTPGMRAVSIPISAETGAGGFILPGDRVDVILVHEIEVTGGRTTREVQTSETILENVRVRAVDQQPQNDDEQAVVGSTVTLEVTQADAETLALAQSRGEITLALRSVADLFDDTLSATGAASRLNQRGSGVRVYRFGSQSQVTVGGGR